MADYSCSSEKRPKLTKRAFPPICDDDTHLLILGSLPGEKSLRAAQYYAHPQNAFWRLAGKIVDRDIACLPYDERVAALSVNGIGLWDVLASAERHGSLDAAIRNPQLADLRALVARLPKLQAVAFNGGTAARLGRGILSDVDTITLIDLPSSSPAFAKPLACKAESWAVLRDFLPPR